MGSAEEFCTVRFRATLASPCNGVWNNDVGRRLRHGVDELQTRHGWTKKGITRHHCAWQGTREDRITRQKSLTPLNHENDILRYAMLVCL